MPRFKITVEDTPNPNALKFTLGRPVPTQVLRLRSSEGEGPSPSERQSPSDRPHSFATPAQAAAHPLAAALFALPGVTNVMFVHDFVTVNKSPATPWKTLTPQIKRVLQTALS